MATMEEALPIAQTFDPDVTEEDIELWSQSQTP